MTFKLLLISALCLLLSGCENLAVQFTPKKAPIASHSPLATEAEGQFWATLHAGRYEDIAKANRLLMAAYLENPNDPQLAAHLGFLHIWQITERHREQSIPPIMVDNIILSTKYFADAVELDPSDARYLGFWGDSRLVEGKIFHDERLQTHGYFTLKKAMRAWPEFNNFTAGFVMSSLPAQSKYFKQGLQWQWQTLDLCAGESVSRDHPDFSPYLKNATQTGPKRACWNSWIAPYNFEGFFLNMGDMLVKSGDWQTAIKIYHNATLAPNYATWPYRKLLETRIANAEANVSHFQQEPAATDMTNESTHHWHDANKTILFNSGYGCVACHQRATH